MARRPLPTDPWLTLLEQIVLDVTGRFADVEERLIREVALELRIDDPGRSPHGESAPRLEAITRLRAAGERAAAELQAGNTAWAEDVIGTALVEGETFAEEWVRRLLGEVPGTRLPHGVLSTALLAQDLNQRFDDVTRRILRWPADVYQRVIARTTPGMLLGIDTSRQAQGRAWSELRRLGVTGFRDKANRRWNLATYVEMATRTSAHRAWTDSNLSTLQSFGMDLVTPIGGRGQCEACGRWVGKVISQGAVGKGRHQVLHSLHDRLVTVNVAGTVDDAIRDGFLHPNCRHTLVGYFPGLNNDTGEKYDRDAEQAQSGLRALEVELRKAKRDLAGALDSNESTGARKRIRELQARIREHIKETGEPRRREREQLNYGHHPGAR